MTAIKDIEIVRRLTNETNLDTRTIGHNDNDLLNMINQAQAVLDDLTYLLHEITKTYLYITSIDIFEDNIIQNEFELDIIEKSYLNLGMKLITLVNTRKLLEKQDTNIFNMSRIITKAKAEFSIYEGKITRLETGNSIFVSLSKYLEEKLDQLDKPDPTPQPTIVVPVYVPHRRKKHKVPRFLRNLEKLLTFR